MLDPVTDSEIKRQKFDISIEGYLPSSFLLLMETLIANNGHFDCHLYLPEFRFFLKKSKYILVRSIFLQSNSQEIWKCGADRVQSVKKEVDFFT